VNLFLADGEVAFQEVFHLHLHVIPRYSGDGFEIRARWKPGREIYSLRTPQLCGKCCDRRPGWKSRRPNRSRKPTIETGSKSR
jgi:diadenosine tetraphosphate (Ap4A) HIT family hydrolase